MAKVTGQSIPSEDRIKYKRQLQISTTSREVNYVRSRYPWRVPISQAGGRAVSAGQLTQRNKFLLVKNLYGTLDAATKQRWVDANPEYKSYLYGYNFFMMEGLSGGGTLEYPQMIKSIQVIKQSVPTTGTSTFNLSPEVDGAKTVVLIQGSARKVPRVLRDSGAIVAAGSTHNIGGTVDPNKCTVKLFGHGYHEEEFWATSVTPYVFTLSTTQITIKWSWAVAATANVSWEVTEHLEGAVYPVLVSISNSQVVMDWAEVPDTAADVSITVVEYL